MILKINNETVKKAFRAAIDMEEALKGLERILLSPVSEFEKLKAALDDLEK